MKLTQRRKGLFRGSQFKTCLPRSILLPALRLLAVYHSYLIFSATALSLSDHYNCQALPCVASIQTFNCSLLANGVCFMLSTASLLSARYPFIEIILNYFSEENVTWKTIISTAEQPLPLACPVHLQCLSIQTYVLSHFNRSGGLQMLPLLPVAFVCPFCLQTLSELHFFNLHFRTQMPDGKSAQSSSKSTIQSLGSFLSSLLHLCAWVPTLFAPL